ncbi:ribosomal protein L7/L12 [Spongisporangium articulatum]|uniref:Ribosomal protein L7/L12 n=1 Tax=Spongisporangium articulatum TaxID=3362603 RepID=A0ABW8AME8_9ACTN
MKLFNRGPKAVYTEPGEFRVVLQLPGAQPLLVVRELRRVSTLDLEAAVAVVKDAPAIVVEGLSEASAGAVVERLVRAGGRAVTHPMENL